MKSSKSTYKNEILITGKDYPQTYREFVTAHSVQTGHQTRLHPATS